MCVMCDTDMYLEIGIEKFNIEKRVTQLHVLNVTWTYARICVARRSNVSILKLELCESKLSDMGNEWESPLARNGDRRMKYKFSIVCNRS